MAPNRRLLKEGHLRALCGTDEGKVKDSQLFLFNDLLVVARLKQRKQGMIVPVSGTVVASMGTRKLILLDAINADIDNLLSLGAKQTLPPAKPAAAKINSGSTGFYFKFKDMMPLAVILLTDRKDGATKNAFEVFAKKLGGGQSKHVFFSIRKEDKDDWMNEILKHAGDALNNEEEEEEEPERPDEWSESSKGEGSKKGASSPSPAKATNGTKKEEEIPPPWEKACINISFCLWLTQFSTAILTATFIIGIPIRMIVCGHWQRYHVPTQPRQREIKL